MVGVRYPQEFLRYVSLGVHKRDIDTFIAAVRTDLIIQSLYLAHPRLLDGPVSDHCSGKGTCGRGGAARGRIDEHGERPATKAPGLGSVQYRA